MTRSISFASLNHFGLQLQPAQQANRSRSSVYRCSREGRQRDGRWLARASATPRRTLPGNIRWSAVPWLERRTSDAVPPGVKDDEGGAKYHGIERKGFLTPAGPRP